MERNGLSGFELLVIVGAVLVGSLGGAVWLGAWAAVAVNGGRLRVSFGDAVTAATRLPSQLGNPRMAWPAEARASFPGPLLYWAATAVLLVAVVAVAAVVFRLMSRSRVGTLPRRPLGVDARARFATARDLKPLAVSGAHPGRFLLGKHGRQVLATELPPEGKRRRRGRQGDRGAVATRRSIPVRKDHGRDLRHP